MAADPFSAVMGDLRGHADSTTETGAEHTSRPESYSDAGRQRRQPGVSHSGLPFQAVSADEALDGLRACSADLGHAPTMKEYARWRVRQPHATVSPSRRSRPPAPAAILRHWGGWRVALQAAGV